MLNIPSRFEGKVITIVVTKGSISPSGWLIIKNI